MRKLIAMLVITAVSVVMLAGCFNQENENLQPPNSRLMGSVAEIAGNTLLVREMEMPGGGRMVFSGGGDGEREIVSVEGSEQPSEVGFVALPATIDCEDEIELCEPFELYEDELDENVELPTRARMAGADAELDRVRVAGGTEGAVIRSEEDMQEFFAERRRYTGNVRSITIPRGMPVIVGTDGETVDISMLEVDDVIFATFDADGRMESFRRMPL